MRKSTSIWIYCGVFIVLVTVLATATPPDAQEQSGIKYQIIDENRLGIVKASIDIRLEHEVDEEILGKIAQELRASGREKFKTLFICYYLPGMEVGSGAWATSHFDPRLEVKILGLTPSERKGMFISDEGSDRDVLGRWIDQPLGAIYTIVEEKSAYTIETKFKDGSGSQKVLHLKERDEDIYLIVPNSSTRDFYFINSNGTLSLYDDMGLIVTLNPTK